MFLFSVPTALPTSTLLGGREEQCPDSKSLGRPNKRLSAPQIPRARSRYLTVLMSFFSALPRLAIDQERSLHCGRDDGRCKGYEEGIQGNDPRFQWLSIKSGGGGSGSSTVSASVRFASISSNNIDGLITVIGIWPSRLLTSASLPTATKSLRRARVSRSLNSEPRTSSSRPSFS